MRIFIHMFAVLALAISWSSPAYAYLDPGTGSIILQGIIGGVAAGAAIIGLYWQKVKALFSSGDKSTSQSSDEE